MYGTADRYLLGRTPYVSKFFFFFFFFFFNTVSLENNLFPMLFLFLLKNVNDSRLRLSHPLTFLLSLFSSLLSLLSLSLSLLLLFLTVQCWKMLRLLLLSKINLSSFWCIMDMFSTYCGSTMAHYNFYFASVVGVAINICNHCCFHSSRYCTYNCDCMLPSCYLGCTKIYSTTYTRKFQCIWN